MNHIYLAASTPEWITSVFAVFVAIASGLWTVTKWLSDRAAARVQDRALADERLRQEAVVEQHRRADRAADLIVKIAEPSAAANRRWLAGALALYPAEATKLLVNALGHSDDSETASAISLALVSIGPSVLPDVLDAHRLARAIVAMQRESASDKSSAADVLGATETLGCTRRIIAHLLLTSDDRASVDLAGVDLSNVNFASADLTAARLRKTVLDGTVFTGARLADANLRGAHAAGAVFTNARLNRADLTGLSGPIGAIRARACGATLQDAVLDGSGLDAADFSDATFLRTSLQKASAPGAVFTRASIQRGHWNRIDLRKASAREATFDGVQLGKALLVEANLVKAQFHGSRLTAIDARSVVAKDAAFIDCNLGGSTLTRADLRGAHLTRCNLSGADLTGTDLSGARIEDCQMNQTILRDVVLLDTVFAGRNRLDAAATLTHVDFSRAIVEDKDLQRALTGDQAGA